MIAVKLACPFMGREYRAFLLSIDPQKRANCVKKALITDCVEDTQNNLFSFKSEFSHRELKLKLGIVNESDLVEITGNQTEKVEETKAIDVKTEEKSVTMDNQNRVKIDIPVIDKPENYESLKVYTNDLLTFKEICDWSDREIIFASLSKSKLTHLRMSMSKTEQEDLDSFVKFLMKNFGVSENRVWTELREFRQKSDESPLALWYRLINLYYQARGISVPEPIQDSSQQKEITNLYQNALRDEELKRIVFTKTIEFTDLPIEVAKIASALTDLKGVSKSLDVMSIDSRGRSSLRSKWSNHSDYRSRSRSKSRERSQDRRSCFRCGRRGHLRHQCHASSKTIRRYKKFLASHRESRSPSHERPSDRKVTFEDEEY